MNFRTLLVLSICGVVFCGCATNHIEKRRVERLDAYTALSSEMRSYVDQGKIKVGMNRDAVYIAWGKPDDITYSENQEGSIEIWYYYSTYMQPHQYWSYRSTWVDDHEEIYPYMQTDYTSERFLRGKLKFKDDILIEWNTHPRP